MPDLHLESFYGHHHVVGVDEAGCGSWVGPVVAACVCLDGVTLPEGVNDSKQLSKKKREALYTTLRETEHVGIGMAGVEEINQLNIVGATKLAMRRAVDALSFAPKILLIDGIRFPKMPYRKVGIPKGDGISLSIAAASIIAKVTRDRLLEKLAEDHPEYGWEQNAGYGTASHQEAIAAHGITPHHRTSYAPIRKIVEAV